MKTKLAGIKQGGGSSNHYGINKQLKIDNPESIVLISAVITAIRTFYYPILADVNQKSGADAIIAVSA